jgi:chemotaxis protein MotA
MCYFDTYRMITVNLVWPRSCFVENKDRSDALLVIIGFLVVIESIVLGYTIHGGELASLFQATAFIIIGGTATGTLLIANPLSLTKRIISGALGTLKDSHINRESYLELLRLFYDLFSFVRREGIVALEIHFEDPAKSAIFSKAPRLLANHQALDFLCDTLRTISMGSIAAHDLEYILDRDLEVIHAEGLQAPHALVTLGHAFPGLGIVAAVLGVIITMGQIDQPPEILGHSVAATLVGTFIGILFAYCFVAPLAKNMEHKINSEGYYLQCIKVALLASVKEAPPLLILESARRAISPEDRPSFKDAEEAIKKI